MGVLGRLHGRLRGRLHGQMFGWLRGQVSGQMSGWTLGWTLGWLPGLLFALAFGLLLAPSGAQAESVRVQEMASCLPGEATAWPDGQDRAAAAGGLRLIYRHAGAPAGFDEAQVLGTVQRALAAWSGCGVPAEVFGEAAARMIPGQVVLVQWDDAGSRGNFGLANLAQRSLSLGPAAFALLAQRNPRHPAHQTLQMVVSHELGHFFGLMAHSRRCVDVMSYYDNGRGETCHTRDGSPYKAVAEYRALLPTACDVERCRAVNRRH